MAFEDLHSGGIGGLYSSVSRELSDAEISIQEEVQAATAAPSFSASEMSGPATGYAMLREDMKMRAARNDDLARRQRIAFADSARNQLHQDAVRRNGQSDSAAAAMTELGALTQGMDVTAAVNQQVRKDPSLAMNPFYIESVKTFGVMTEDPTEKFLREKGQDIAKAKILSEQFDANMALELGKVKWQHLDDYISMTRKAVEEGRIMGDARVIEANLKKLEVERDYRMAGDSYSRLAGFLEKSGAQDPSGLIEDASYMFNSLGFENFNFDTFVENRGTGRTTEGQMRFMSDKQAMAERSTQLYKNPDQLAKEISVLGDADVLRRAEEGDPDAKKAVSRANSLLMDGAGFYRQRYKSQIEQAARKEKLDELGGNLNRSYLKMMDGVRDIFSNAEIVQGDYARAYSKTRSWVQGLANEHGVSLASELSRDEKIAALKTAGDESSDWATVTDEEIAKKNKDYGLWIDDSETPWMNEARPEETPPYELEDYFNDLNRWADAAIDIIAKRKGFEGQAPEPKSKTSGSTSKPETAPTKTKAGTKAEASPDGMQNINPVNDPLLSKPLGQ